MQYILTLAQITATIGWQAHSVRAKKPGVRIESSKNDSGERVYRTTE